MQENTMNNLPKLEKNEVLEEFQKILLILGGHKMKGLKKVSDMVEKIKQEDGNIKKIFSKLVAEGNVFALKALHQLIEEKNIFAQELYQKLLLEKDVYAEDLKKYIEGSTDKDFICPKEENIDDNSSELLKLKCSIRRAEPKAVALLRKLLNQNNIGAFDLLKDLALEGNNRAISILGKLVFKNNPEAVKIMEEIKKEVA